MRFFYCVIGIEDLAKRIVEITGSKSKIEYISYEEAYGQPFDDMMRRVPCLGRRYDRL